jgi:hypothetical protein
LFECDRRRRHIRACENDVTVDDGDEDIRQEVEIEEDRNSGHAEYGSRPRKYEVESQVPDRRNLIVVGAQCLESGDGSGRMVVECRAEQAARVRNGETDGRASECEHLLQADEMRAAPRNRRRKRLHTLGVVVGGDFAEGGYDRCVEFTRAARGDNRRQVGAEVLILGHHPDFRVPACNCRAGIPRCYG